MPLSTLICDITNFLVCFTKKKTPALFIPFASQEIQCEYFTASWSGDKKRHGYNFIKLNNTKNTYSERINIKARSSAKQKNYVISEKCQSTSKDTIKYFVKGP